MFELYAQCPIDGREVIGAVTDVLLSCTGRSRIKLKSTGEVFTINPCNVKANNVIVGSTWVDNEGDYALINTTTGARADMYFTPCGWWGNGRYQVRFQL